MNNGAPRAKRRFEKVSAQLERFRISTDDSADTGEPVQMYVFSLIFDGSNFLM